MIARLVCVLACCALRLYVAAAIAAPAASAGEPAVRDAALTVRTCFMPWRTPRFRKGHGPERAETARHRSSRRVHAKHPQHRLSAHSTMSWLRVWADHSSPQYVGNIRLPAPHTHSAEPTERMDVRMEAPQSHVCQARRHLHERSWARVEMYFMARVLPFFGWRGGRPF